MNKFVFKVFAKFSKSLKYSLGVSHVINMRSKYKKIKNINDLDYKVYSQNGEDGIIDYLLYSLKIDKSKCKALAQKYTWEECAKIFEENCFPNY